MHMNLHILCVLQKNQNDSNILVKDMLKSLSHKIQIPDMLTCDYSILYGGKREQVANFFKCF